MPAANAAAPLRAVERWPYRFCVYSVAALLALGVEITYTRLVPKMPQLYAALIRAAVWDCIFVGVFVAQLVDLANLPFLEGIDNGHYLPCVVLLYHAIAFTFCGAYDLWTQQGSGRSRTLHRSLVCRRVLLELAGGKSGTNLFLGRICFIVSGAAMWLALHVLLLIDDDTTVLMLFIVLSFVAYSAAGLAALEPRRSLPGQLVQWLCTGWGSREALLQGPLKIIGALLMLPFTASVIAAQVWLRTISFIVWLAVACPCCRLQIADNVFDAFEQELAVPLLQCSFLAFACTLGGMVLDSELSGMQRMTVGIVAAYYTAMLLIWTAPAVLQAKVAAEERAGTWDENSVSEPLNSREEAEEVEMEQLLSTCEELKALLQRDRHDHAVESGRLTEKLRDQERVNNALTEKLMAEERMKNSLQDKLVHQEQVNRALTEELMDQRRVNNALSEKLIDETRVTSSVADGSVGACAYREADPSVGSEECTDGDAGGHSEGSSGPRIPLPRVRTPGADEGSHGQQEADRSQEQPKHAEVDGLGEEVAHRETNGSRAQHHEEVDGSGVVEQGHEGADRSGDGQSSEEVDEPIATGEEGNHEELDDSGAAEQAADRESQRFGEPSAHEEAMAAKASGACEQDALEKTDKLAGGEQCAPEQTD